MRRYTDQEHGFGDIMPSATIHIRPTTSDISALKIQNYELFTGYNMVTTRTMGCCATSGGTAISACYISIPVSSIVFVDALVTAFCTAGNAAGSGAAYRMEGMITSAGLNSRVTVTPLSASSMTCNVWTPGIASAASVNQNATTNKVALTVTGSGKHEILWIYDLTTIAVVA